MLHRVIFIICFVMTIGPLQAQRDPDRIYMPGIRTVKLHPPGNPVAPPVLKLNSTDQLELNFDEMGSDVHTYYYTFQLCDVDWMPVQMSFFDYVKGFSRVRITNYRTASITLSRYIHYNAILPDRNCMPTKSGNYLLKVFADGDTSRLAFTRRILVVDQRMDVALQILQPFNQRYFQTHHRLQLSVSGRGIDIRYPQQQVKVHVLQNMRWDNRLQLSNPTFVRQDLLQYNNETEMLLPAGKEWRWLNLRSFRLLGDRVRSQRNNESSFRLFVQEERPRLPNQYFYFRDLNGGFVNETVERINPYWNADYADVHFTFIPPGGQPFRGKDLFVFGEITGYGKNDGAKMIFDPAAGVYRTTISLKQGYYDYMYATRERDQPAGTFSTEWTESDRWETENEYIVLVYYRELGGRYDQLLGITRGSSQFRQDAR
jgi:hypothetical protein